MVPYPSTVVPQDVQQHRLGRPPALPVPLPVLLPLPPKQGVQYSCGGTYAATPGTPLVRHGLVSFRALLSPPMPSCGALPETPRACTSTTVWPCALHGFLLMPQHGIWGCGVWVWGAYCHTSCVCRRSRQRASLPPHRVPKRIVTRSCLYTQHTSPQHVAGSGCAPIALRPMLLLGGKTRARGLPAPCLR